MKTLAKGLLNTVALLLLANTSSFAIEGLQVSLQSSNVVLHWPSTDGENYIVQYRPALNPTSDWATITSALPADSGTNLTFFIHTNAAQFGWTSGGTNGGASIDLNNTNGVASGTNSWGSGFGFYRVVKDGVRLLDSSMLVLTNGVLSNSVSIGFEAGNADGSGTNVLGVIESADLLVDGVKFAGDGVLDSPINISPWRFSMDTAYLENGDHTLQVEVSWLNPDNSDGNHVNITRQSDSIPITVSNVIYYPQWEPEVGEAGISAYFLKTTCTNADWQIDIYDVSNRLAKTLTGHTYDGTIEAYWNMVDTNGVTRTNADLDPEFSSIVTVADPITKETPSKKQRANNWPDHGKWVITYQDFFKFEYSANNRIQGSINSFASTAAKYGGYYLYYPPSGSTNDVGQTYPIRYQKINHFDINITDAAISKDHALLKSFLSNTNSRNLYYHGHGSPVSIAGGFLASEVKASVKHRYRFVFLNGCDTANGGWDAAFGIHGPGQFDITHYENTGIRPAAFCGYNIEIPYATGGIRTVSGVTYDDTIPDDVPYFVTNFLFYWDLEQYSLTDAIYYGKQYLSAVGGWYPGTGLQVYGYADLKIDDFNHATDTW